MAINVDVEGIGVSIDEATFNDYELLEAIADMDDRSLTDVVRLNRMIFGTEQWEGIKAELKARNGGKLGIDTVASFMRSFFKAVPESSDKAKN